MPQQAKSLYERIGGDFAISAVVDGFYEKVLNDERINFFFENISMDAQIGKLKKFLKVAFGGQEIYTGKDMRKAHAPLVARGLNDSHVDALLEHMSATLREIGVKEDLIQEVIEIIESYRDDVLCRRKSSS